MVPQEDLRHVFSGGKYGVLGMGTIWPEYRGGLKEEAQRKILGSFSKAPLCTIMRQKSLEI